MTYAHMGPNGGKMNRANARPVSNVPYGQPRRAGYDSPRRVNSSAAGGRRRTPTPGGASRKYSARRQFGGESEFGAKSRNGEDRYSEYLRRQREYLKRVERERQIRELKLCRKQVKAELKRDKQAARARAKRERKAAERERERREIKIRRARLPFSFVAMLAAATILIMAVVYSYSQVSEATTKLSNVEDRLAELDSEASRLNHDLSVKNDAEVIAKRATEDLMMVRESSIDKKYISLASDDRVVLEDDGEEEPRKGNPLLSAFSAVFGDLMDHIS